MQKRFLKLLDLLRTVSPFQREHNTTEEGLTEIHF